MSFLDLPGGLPGWLLHVAGAPPWLWALLGLQGLATAGTVARHGRLGLAWAAAGGVVLWLLAAFAASWLVARLEGGRAADIASVLSGAGRASLRLAALAWPFPAAGAAFRLIWRRWGRSRMPPPQVMRRCTMRP